MYPIKLDDFENYMNPPTSREITTAISEQIKQLKFLGEGAFLNKGDASAFFLLYGNKCIAIPIDLIVVFLVLFCIKKIVKTMQLSVSYLFVVVCKGPLRISRRQDWAEGLSFYYSRML